MKKDIISMTTRPKVTPCSQRTLKPRRMHFLWLFSVLLAFSVQNASAQDISQIAQSDPLIISGSIGTRNTYYHSTSSYGYASPLSNSIYANLDISIYGFSMPFSLYYSNDNLDFNYPHISFNLTPHYKNWTGYVGRSSMQFSSYVMSMSFNGVGVEYNNKKTRFGVFYGNLRSAVNDDPTDPAARTPQYRRVGWGFKVGYGNASNYIDLYMLRAHDQLKSLHEGWRGMVMPEENLVVGVKGGLSPLPRLVISANVATSAFTSDTQSEKITMGEVTRFDKIFDAKTTSSVRFAGDVSMSYSFLGISTALTYRMIQPDYKSLGTYYMSNNYHSLGVNLSTMLFKKISLSGSFSGQEDNLTDKQLYTTRGFVYNAMASTRIGEHFNLMAGYNGYTQVQGDGTAKVNEQTKIHRLLQSFTFTPTYMVDNETFSHTVNLSANYTDNKDKNKYATGQSDVKTTGLGLSYGITIKPWELDLNTSLSHQLSKGYQSEYKSDIAALTASRAFLKDKNLSVSATGTLCYNEVKYQSKNLSMGFDASVGYTLKKAHTFSLSGGLNKYGDVNMTKQRSNLDDLDINVSFNYAYIFSLLEIKRKADKKEM